MPFRENEFWSEILGSPAQRHALLVANSRGDPRNLLRKAEIDDAQVSLFVNEQVLRLEVAVDIAQRVDLREGARDAARGAGRERGERREEVDGRRKRWSGMSA